MALSLSLTAIMLRLLVALPVGGDGQTVSHTNALGSRNILPPLVSVPAGGGAAVTTLAPLGAAHDIRALSQAENVSEYEELDLMREGPPKELYPLPEPEAPILVAAGARILEFTVIIPCSSGCPNTFYWFYRKKGKTSEENWKEITDGLIKQAGNKKISTATLTEIDQNTMYYVKVKPSTYNESSGMRNWYKLSKHAPFSPISYGLTCNEEQDGVRNLIVHSAGPQWLGVSWLPPTPQCTTHLQYRARLDALLQMRGEWRVVGSYWSNASWAMDGDVKPCLLWPGRHCLLITKDVSPEKNYTVQLQVVRSADKRNSAILSTWSESKTFGPSAPEALRCVAAQPTELSLHWRCPLSPGGQLKLARVRIREALAPQTFDDIKMEVGLQAEYQTTVKMLKPATLYKVEVWFENAGNFAGMPATIEAWTPPINTRNSVSPCETTAVDGEAVASTGVETRKADGGVSWPWLLVFVIVLLCACLLTFFAGRYWSNRYKWRIIKFSKTSSACSSEAGTGSSKVDTDVAGVDMEEAALCGVTKGPSKGTPPSSLVDYSEPSPYAGYASLNKPANKSSGAPAAAATRALPPRVSLHHYEDPKNIYDEQAYVEALDATQPPPPLYSEVQHPSPAAMPLYAEVDKKRRVVPPLPPTAPPPLPRHPKPAPLQDSD